MAEYTIVGVEPVEKTLKLFYPHLRLKQKQAQLALDVLAKMPGRGRKFTPKLLYSLAYEVDKFADLNYSKKRTKTSKVVREFLTQKNLLDPVETES